jgi:hypothetical protein
MKKRHDQQCKAEFIDRIPQHKTTGKEPSWTPNSTGITLHFSSYLFFYDSVVYMYATYLVIVNLPRFCFLLNDIYIDNVYNIHLIDLNLPCLFVHQMHNQKHRPIPKSKIRNVADNVTFPVIQWKATYDFQLSVTNRH